ncbi:uncharacterized protein ASCRUDRAFT_76839 [Ascoidea rubescens DSM 1968]|uniref:Uncharacterized protein n=1 Tax=Ascoidea rubescens DSM 1968 TaxID=1344418 RepID=A0A1D2VE75_9ASCO|nr:hypothetical protein ASCRUDRAFT_76839 [Ascoidea rubescens DSM 1968]ODV59909.1 hypothetical protein ASCRUDRAFT_76839 [Ascoidea rubescens DSM 1968]
MYRRRIGIRSETTMNRLTGVFHMQFGAGTATTQRAPRRKNSERDRPKIAIFRSPP